LAYSLIRLGVFAGSFILLLLASVVWWLAAPIAAVVSFCVGYVFFGKLRDAVARDLQERRANPSQAGDEEDLVF
jgi:hypothetical protein